MTLRLKLNSKIDPTLAAQVPNDEYPDTTVKPQYDQLQLSTAYLSMESETFANLPPDSNLYDLSQFDQNSTVAVLQSLYGGPLECSSPS